MVENENALLPKEQKTPYGPMSITSRWKAEQYQLVAYGPEAALTWAFPKARGFEKRPSDKVRYVFRAAKDPITDVAVLGALRDRFMARWNERLRVECTTAELPVVITTVGAKTSASNAPATFAALGQRFTAAQRGFVSVTTLQKYELHLARWHTHLGADITLSSITPEKILLARQRLAAEVGARTVNGSMQTLRRVLRFALDEGWIESIPWRGIKPLPEAEFKSQWWTPEQAAIALDVAARDRHQPTALLLIAIGIMLGLRKGEATQLLWSDLLLDRTDPQTGKPAPVCHLRCEIAWKPKSKKARDIPIPEPLHRLLLAHRQESGYVLQPERNRPKRGGTKRVYRWDANKVWLRVRAACLAKGLPDIRFHDLRHSMASNLIGAGISAEKVASWLGHRDTRMVHRTYGHLLAYDDSINAVAYQLPNLP